MYQNVKSLEHFIDSLLNHCEEPSIMKRFHSDITKEDENYTKTIKKISNIVETNLGKSIVSRNDEWSVRCMSCLGNCYVLLADSSGCHPSKALCFETEPNITITRNRDTFTFFANVELLLSPNCNGNSFECSFTKNDDRKTFIRYIQNTFFKTDGSEKKLSFLEDEETCIEILKRIRSEEFTSLDLQDQTEDIKKARTNCVSDEVQKDHQIFLKQLGIHINECLGKFQESSCYKGTILQNTIF